MHFSSKKYKSFLVVLVFLLSSFIGNSQTTPNWNADLTPNGANSLVFRFTKQVWLNPTIILARKEFEASTHVKLLLLPRINNNDTSSNSKLENAFDKVFALLYSDEITGSIKFYFNSQNTAKPFTFATSEELWCKFTPAQKDTVEQLLNKVVASNSDMSDFSKLPFESVINQASKYCKQVLLSSTKTCGGNPQQVFSSININSVPAKLNFEQAPYNSQPTGDVDEQQYDALKIYYNSATDSTDNSNYPIAWKAMSSSNDVIKLKLKKKNPNFNLADVKFKNSGGTETYTTQISTDDNTLLKINIPGKPAGSMAEVVAYYTTPSTATTYPIGAFNVQFYQSKPAIKLVLVNLGAAKMPDIKAVQEELAKTYGSIFINWALSVLDYNLPTDINKSLIIENSSLLSNYPPSMQPIIKDFKSKNNVDANTYYLFFGCTNNNSLLGYMPRARNIGFIFDSSPHTIAHELGHGAFNLKHIFSSDELGEGNRGQTDNLMDYAPVNGSATKPQEALYKYQWDLIHNPSFVGWFEGDDEEGALAKRTWFTPDWKAFTLGDETRTINSDPSKYKINQGTIPGIVYKGNKYIAVFDNNIFKGYFTATESAPLTLTYLTLNDDSYCSLFFNYGCGKSKYYTTKYSYVKQKREVNKDDFIIGSDFKKNITKDSGLVACNTVPPQNTTFVINKSHIDYQSKDLEILLNGGKKFSEADRTYQGTIAKLYLTSSKSSQEEYDEVAKASQQKDDTLRLWLHYTVDSVWIIKKGIQQDAFDKVLASYNLKPAKQFDAIISETGVGIEQLASTLYTIGDWISFANKGRMPEAWWNCSNELVYNPPLLVKVMSIALAPLGEVMDPIIKKVAPNLLKENESTAKITFATYAGVWDGMIGFVGGIGDGVKMATMSFATSNAEALTATANMSKLISDNGGGIGGFGNLMWSGIKSGFDLDKPCVLSHTVGEFSFTIVLAVFTGGEALASTAVGRVILKSVAVLDKLDVVSLAVSKTAGCVLKVTYKASKPVFKVLYNGIKVIPEFFNVPATGKMYSFVVPLPQVNIKGGVDAFKEAMAKGELKVEAILDKEGKVILDDEGNALFKAVKNDGEEVLVVEKVNLPSILRQLQSRPSYKSLRTIWSKQNTTISFIGKWDELIGVEQNGLQKIFNELSENDLNIYMVTGKFEHPGGFNMLSIDNFAAKQSEYVKKLQLGQINSAWTFDDYIWEAYNKPWLENALQRSDDIIIWSDPVNSRTGFYKRELDFIQLKGSKYGYDYDMGIKSGTFTK